MSVVQVPVISSYILGIVFGLFIWLPSVDATARFTRFPPSVLYVSNGGTARFVWDYHVDDKRAEFQPNSPVWSFIGNGGNDKQIGSDDRYTNNWSFVISRSTCPPRLLNPDRVSRESTATLVITNVTTADNGIYRCSLNLKAGNPIIHQVQLVVTDATARFTRFPPSVLCVSNGGTARFVWDYHVDDRLQTFTAESPKWSFFLAGDELNEKTIGIDDRYTNNWSFVMSRSTCPPRLLNPDRVSRESTATLVITNVTTGDNGMYKCSLVLKAGNPINHQVQLVVTVPPTFLPNHPNKTYQIIEGQDLKANCTAIGPPTPNITWVNVTDGSVATKSRGSGSAVLQINNIKLYHAGVYECQARNNPDEDAATTRTSVSVYYKPSVNRIMSTKSQHSWNSKMTTFKCIVDGFPTPDVTWYNPSGQQIPCGVKKLTDGSQLTITTTTECSAEYGSYKCQATNAAGRDEHFISVSQLFPPGPPKISILEKDIQASSVEVRWMKPGYDGGNPVIGYKIRINTKPLQEKTTTSTHTNFFGLTKNTSYLIDVVAINDVGAGNLSQVAITTKKQGKPMMPEMIAVLYSSKESKMSVLLTWKKPDDNGGTIEKYTIYMKVVQSQSQWEKIADVTSPAQLQYTVTNNIGDENSYMFIVTAWNEYGESARNDAIAKTVNTKKDIAIIKTDPNTAESCKALKSKHDTVVGITSSFLVLSLGLNILLLVLLWRRANKIGKEHEGTTTRVTVKEQSVEKRDNAITQLAQPVPEYEAVQAIGNTSVAGPPFPSPSQYQELDMLSPSVAPQDQGPAYETLRTKSKEPNSTTEHFNQEQHPYEALGLKNKSSDYQSLQTFNI